MGTWREDRQGGDSVEASSADSVTSDFNLFSCEKSIFIHQATKCVMLCYCSSRKLLHHWLNFCKNSILWTSGVTRFYPDDQALVISQHPTQLLALP